MEAIRVTTITGAMLVSSTVAEPDTGETAWSALTTYAEGDRAIRTSTHRIYESLVAGNLNHTPETSPTQWVDAGPTNKWAVFDELIDTVTTGASPLTYVFNPGLVEAFALLGLVGQTAQVSIVVGASTVYDETFDLDGSIIADDYDYMFAPFNQRTQVVATDLAPYDGTWTVTITGASTASVGVIAVGTTDYLGRLGYGAQAGYISYSGIDTDTFGRTKITRRRAVKSITGQLLVDRPDINRVSRSFADLDGRLAIFVGTPDDDYEPLTVYGFVTDATGQMDGPNHAFYSFSARGF